MGLLADNLYLSASDSRHQLGNELLKELRQFPHHLMISPLLSSAADFQARLKIEFKLAEQH